MHANPFRPTAKLTKAQAKLLNKAVKALNKETDKQLDIVYHAAAIALYRFHGWNSEQLFDLVAHISQDVWNECAGYSDVSMIELCWDYLGIELQCEDKTQHWYEVQYLNSEIVDHSPMTVYQYIAVRQNQVKWIAPQITACILIALWKKESWKEDAIAKLFKELEQIKAEFHHDPEALRKACNDETGFCITDDILPVDREG